MPSTRRRNLLAIARGRSPSHFTQQVTSSPGWTDRTYAGGGNHYYVSSSLGDDSNDGLSESTPFQTLFRGYSAIANNSRDRLSLRRGDAWAGESLGQNTGQIGKWEKSGVGPAMADRISVDSYGDLNLPRPLIDSHSEYGIWVGMQSGGNLAFFDLDFVNRRREFNGPLYDATATAIDGVRVTAGVHDVLFEGIRTMFHGTGFSCDFDSFTGNYPERVTFKRCVAAYNYPIGSHGQGWFSNGAHYLTLDECILVQNGWNPARQVAKTVFNHSAYLHHQKNLLVDKCWNIDGSNMAWKLKSNVAANRTTLEGSYDGTVNNCICSLCGIGISYGGNIEAVDIGFLNQVSDGNIYIDMIGGPPSNLVRRGYGIKSIDGFSGTNNLFVQSDAISGNWPAVWVLDLFPNGVLNGNIDQSLIHRWDSGSQPLVRIDPVTGFTETNSIKDRLDSEFVDPTLTLGSYAAARGLSPTTEALMAALAEQRYGNWREDLETPDCQAYLRAGFTLV